MEEFLTVAMNSDDARGNDMLNHYLTNIYNIMFKDEVSEAK